MQSVKWSSGDMTSHATNPYVTILNMEQLINVQIDMIISQLERFSEKPMVSFTNSTVFIQDLYI